MQKTFEWNISDFFYKLDANSIQSARFLCGGFTFYVNMYPRGQNQNRHMGIYLHLDPKDTNDLTFLSHWEVNVKSKFVLLARNVKSKISATTNWTKWFESNKYTREAYNWGYSEFIPLREIGKYVCGDNDTLRIRAIVKINSYKNITNKYDENGKYCITEVIEDIPKDYKMSDDKSISL